MEFVNLKQDIHTFIARATVKYDENNFNTYLRIIKVKYVIKIIDSTNRYNRPTSKAKKKM